MGRHERTSREQMLSKRDLPIRPSDGGWSNTKSFFFHSFVSFINET